MKIQIISDIHAEYNIQFATDFALQLDSSDVDVLVLAGDIVGWSFSLEALEYLSIFNSKYPNVVYVTGNHEYWKTDFLKANKQIQTFIDTLNNFLFLTIDNPVTIQGQRFIGDTLWFPQTVNTDILSTGWVDYENITNFRDNVYKHNEEVRNKLWKNLSRQDIVVTHHLPTNQCIGKWFRYDASNCFFVGDCEELIFQFSPKLWIHGHSHTSFDEMIYDTRVIRNPLGNSSALNKKFIEKFIVEV